MSAKTDGGATGRRLRVTQIKSTIGFDKRQAAVVRGLGLRRIGHSVEVVDHPATRGMIHKVRHLVVVEVAGPEGGRRPGR